MEIGTQDRGQGERGPGWVGRMGDGGQQHVAVAGWGQVGWGRVAQRGGSMERGGWNVNIGGQHVKDGWYTLWQAACGWGLWVHTEGARNTFGQHEDMGTEHVAMGGVDRVWGLTMGVLSPCWCQTVSGWVAVRVTLRQGHLYTEIL